MPKDFRRIRQSRRKLWPRPKISRRLVRHSSRSALRSSNTLPKTRQEKASTTKDRKSTRLNSSHLVISYAVFCLKKKTDRQNTLRQDPLSDLRNRRPLVHKRLCLVGGHRRPQ